MGMFLNGEYITDYIGNDYKDMIEDNTTWYIGTVREGTSYKLSKYKDTSMSEYSTSTEAKVGLLRYGELIAGQFNVSGNNTTYSTLTPLNPSYVWHIYPEAYGMRQSGAPVYQRGVKPSLNLKSNVIITSGDGTKNNPFTIELSN